MTIKISRVIRSRAVRDGERMVGADKKVRGSGSRQHKRGDPAAPAADPGAEDKGRKEHDKRRPAAQEGVQPKADHRGQHNAGKHQRIIPGQRQARMGSNYTVG